MKGIRDKPKNVPLRNSLPCDEQEAFNPLKMPLTYWRCEKCSLHSSSHMTANKNKTKQKKGYIAPTLLQNTGLIVAE